MAVRSRLRSRIRGGGKGTGGGPPPPSGDWTPADDPLAFGWWDPSDASTITETTGSVSQIDDKTGAGNHMVQATEASQPTTGTDLIGGLNAFRFAAGTTQYLEDTAFPNPVSGNVCITGVFKPESFVVVQASILSMDAADRDWQFQSQSTTDFNGQVNSSGLGGNAFLALSGGPFNGPSIFQMNFDFTSGVRNVYVDGVKRAGDTGYLTTLNPTVLFRWMTSRPANTPTGGLAGELTCSEDVTEDIRTRYEGYLAWKWGTEANLPVGHPYKNAPPQV